MILRFGLRRGLALRHVGDCVRHRFWGVRAAHFLAIPLLAAPAAALRVNDAGSSATAAFVVLQGVSPVGE
jgi:hypothetical protein